VIEDCAHGFGLAVTDGLLGGRGDVAALSFHATKLIGGGEGGAVVTGRADVADSVRAWRDYGNEPPDGTRLNDKLSDVHAAIAGAQLDRLDAMIAARHARAQRYHTRLESTARRTGTFRLPGPREQAAVQPTRPPRVWYRYVVELTERTATDVVERLRERGIGAARPVTEWRPAGAPACPSADRAYAHLVSLPLYPTLRDDEQDRVCNALEAVLASALRG
jgi:dTDP-4-amino-4,6-dideoxygalactose transaminase